MRQSPKGRGHFSFKRVLVVFWLLLCVIIVEDLLDDEIRTRTLTGTSVSISGTIDHMVLEGTEISVTGYAEKHFLLFNPETHQAIEGTIQAPPVGWNNEWYYMTRVTHLTSGKWEQIEGTEGLTLVFQSPTPFTVTIYPQKIPVIAIGVMLVMALFSIGICGYLVITALIKWDRQRRLQLTSA